MSFRVQGRHWWTADRSRLVGEGDPEAAFLAYPHGAEIPETEAQRVGLLKAAPRRNDKMAPPPANK